MQEGGGMIGTSISAEWAPNSETDGGLLELHAYWLSVGRNGQIPFRKDIQPTSMPRHLLRAVFLVDVLNEPRNFRFRLAGSAFREGSGQEVTGRLIDEVFPPDYTLQVRELWGAVVDGRRPRWGAGRMWSESRSFVDWQGVVMPVQSEGGEVIQLLGAIVFNVEAAKRLRKS